MNLFLQLPSMATKDEDGADWDENESVDHCKTTTGRVHQVPEMNQSRNKSTENLKRTESDSTPAGNVQGLQTGGPIHTPMPLIHIPRSAAIHLQYDGLTNHRTTTEAIERIFNLLTPIGKEDFPDRRSIRLPDPGTKPTVNLIHRPNETKKRVDRLANKAKPGRLI